MKLFVALMSVLFAFPSWADDDVVSRASCTDIQAQISELVAVTEPDDETADKLVQLKNEYRQSCARSAAGRRTAADARGTVEIVETDTETDVPEEAVSESEPVADVAEDVVVSTEITEPVLTVEQELANLDAGLCADGSQPNKFGCCGDEIFKDLGDTVFACCIGDGEDMECYSPIE